MYKSTFICVCVYSVHTYKIDIIFVGATSCELQIPTCKIQLVQCYTNSLLYKVGTYELFHPYAWPDKWVT